MSAPALTQPPAERFNPSRVAATTAAALTLMCCATTDVTAQSVELSGWTRTTLAGTTTYSHRSARASIVVRELSPDEARDLPATLRAVSAALETQRGCSRLSRALHRPTHDRGGVEVRISLPTIRCQVLIVPRSTISGALVIAVNGSPTRVDERAAASLVLRSAVLSPAAVSGGGNNATASVPAPRREPAPLPIGPSDGKSVLEALFLHGRNYGSGFVSTLIALERGGRYVEIDGTAPEDIGTLDLARTAHGRWTRIGTSYRLISTTNDTTEFTASDAHAPFPSSTRLSGAYRSVTGSLAGFGNTGGVTLTSFFIFHANGQFATTSDAAISLSTPNADIAGAGSASTQRGSYRIEGHTISLTFRNGEVRRMSIAEIKGGGIGNASTWVIGGRLFFTD
jgi:hypothetical protein